MIFVFGSNVNGWHGKGAALEAKLKYGAIQGHGNGPQGKSYAIPTKDHQLRPLGLEKIKLCVTSFLEHARKTHWETFFVTRIGCGLAGYKDEQIAPMFKGAPLNCLLPDGW